MEEFVLGAVVNELAAHLERAGTLRLGKIFITGAFSIGLDLRLRDGGILICSARPNDNRFYLTMRHPKALEADAPGEPAFVQRIRKVLSGGRLFAIEKPRGERSVTLKFEAFNDAGNVSKFAIRHDLTGRSSNLYLLDEDDRVLDVLRPAESVIVGTLHELPASKNQKDWDEIAWDDLPSEPAELEKFLRATVRGCGATLAREVAFLASEIGAPNALEQTRQRLRDSASGFIYRTESKSVLSSIPLRQFPDAEVLKFATVNEAADTYFNLLDRTAILNQKRHIWGGAVANWRKRLDSTLNKIVDSQSSDADAETWRRWGELLYANVKTGTRNATGIEVVDYYDEHQRAITIPLEDGEEITDAARRYFRKYQKHQRAQTAAQERLELLEKQSVTVEFLEKLFREADDAESLDAAIAEAAIALPVELRPKQASENAKARSRENEWSGLRRYRGPNGFEIVVGRNDRDNDRLTFKLARPMDLWLHAADYPGSHVLVRNPTRQPVPHHVVIAAAELAAFFSKAKNDDKVNVHYVEKRRLSRPKNGAPGAVLLSESKTVLATPRETLERIL